MDRRLFALGAAGAAVVAVVLVLLLSGGEDDDKTPARKALADPITLVPADADAIVDVDLGAPLPALAFAQLLPRNLRGDLPVRGRAVIALRSTQRWLAFQGRDRVRLVGSRARVGASRSVFERRVAALPRNAGVRAAFKPAALLARLGDAFARTRYARTLTDGAAALVARESTAVLQFRLTGTTPQGALPIAPGTPAPRPRGSGAIVAGVSDPARMLRFVREAGMFPELDVLDRLPGFLRPDLDNLGRDGSVISDGRGAITARVQPPDPRDWARKLDRFDALSGLARRLGLADVRIDREGDAYRVEQNDRFALRIGVFGNTLVLSNREDTNLRAVAQASARKAPGRGGLTALLEPEALLASLGVQVPGELLQLDTIGGWVRADTRVTVGELNLKFGA